MSSAEPPRGAPGPGSNRFREYARRRPGQFAGWLVAWVVLAMMLDYALSTSGPSTGDNWQLFVAAIYFVIAPAVTACVFGVVWAVNIAMRRRRPGLPSLDEARDAADRRAALAGGTSRI